MDQQLVRPSLPPLARDLARSSQQVLRAYLRDGSPEIELAAELPRTSVRTLQRRLAKLGSYLI